MRPTQRAATVLDVKAVVVFLVFQSFDNYLFPSFFPAAEPLIEPLF